MKAGVDHVAWRYQNCRWLPTGGQYVVYPNTENSEGKISALVIEAVRSQHNDGRVNAVARMLSDFFDGARNG
jgi:hypothetical protein